MSQCNRKVFEGMRFGMLTAWMEVQEKYRCERKFLCICECGNFTVLPAYQLRTGATKSCGCLKKPHGLHGSKVYSSWRSMLKRCYNPSHRSYKHYGAVGITVCDEWRKSFIQFLKDMGMPPTEKHSIDRIDGTKGYSPDNCRWATITEQANNKRNNRLITYRGVTKTVAQWAITIGITRQSLGHRLAQGWPIDVALETKSYSNRRQ